MSDQPRTSLVHPGEVPREVTTGAGGVLVAIVAGRNVMINNHVASPPTEPTPFGGSCLLRAESYRAQDGVEVCSLDGEVDHVTAPRLQQLLADCTDRQVPRVVLDLSRLSFFGLAGIGVLATAAAQAADFHGRISLVPSHAVTRTLQVTGYSRSFATYDTLDEALAVESVLAAVATGRQP